MTKCSACRHPIIAATTYAIFPTSASRCSLRSSISSRSTRISSPASPSRAQPGSALRMPKRKIRASFARAKEHGYNGRPPLTVALSELVACP